MRGSTSRGSRVMRAVAAVSLMMGGIVVAGSSPALAAVDCSVTPTNASCTRTRPVVECVWLNGDGTFTALFGTNNTGTEETGFPYGPTNAITPAPANRAQPMLIPKGHKKGTFFTTGTTTIAWKIGTRTVTARTTTRKCATKPVTAFGDARALVLGAGAILVVGLFVRRRRTSLPSVTAADRRTPADAGVSS